MDNVLFPCRLTNGNVKYEVDMFIADMDLVMAYTIFLMNFRFLMKATRLLDGSQQ